MHFVSTKNTCNDSRYTCQRNGKALILKIVRPSLSITLGAVLEVLLAC